MKILIADDDESIRKLLTTILKNLGHSVIIASDGIEAWKILEKVQIRVIISDWIMPNMNGLELCKKIRAVNLPYYVYIILLTSKDSKLDLIEGFEAGADEFLSKPFNIGEFKARLKATERILTLKEELENKNNELAESNNKLENAYIEISNDLKAAADVQKKLLPCSGLTLNGFKFEWLFLPCSFVAGDIFNFYKLDEKHIGFYIIDVAGHGVPAAMLSVTLSNILSPIATTNNQLKKTIENMSYYEILSPVTVTKELNKRFLLNDDNLQYFTMIYGFFNIENGKCSITQAGHPSLIHQSINGEITLIGDGGFPVGILPNAEYDEKHFQLEYGDRLFLYSDGITECNNENGEMYSIENLTKLIKTYQKIPLKDLINKLDQNLNKWKGSNQFNDDITLLCIERV